LRQVDGSVEASHDNSQLVTLRNVTLKPIPCNREPLTIFTRPPRWLTPSGSRVLDDFTWLWHDLQGYLFYDPEPQLGVFLIRRPEDH